MSMRSPGSGTVNRGFDPTSLFSVMLGKRARRHDGEDALLVGEFEDPPDGVADLADLGLRCPDA